MIQVFFALIKAGLWEKKVRLESYGPIDFSVIYHLASQQKVVGLVAEGLDCVEDVEISSDDLVPFAGDSIEIEQCNLAMNQFIARLFTVFHKNGVPAILVKGQGIARCYERPLCRTCGDIDLLFDNEHYQDAKKNMLAKASSVAAPEDTHRLHIAINMDSWVVELHGTLYCRSFPRINKMLFEVQNEVFKQKRIRHWDNGGVDIPLPAPDDDVIFVFTHILGHFFNEGVGLRQICDWCRLLYTYRDTLDRPLLRRRLTSMRLMSEWKTFSAFAVSTLAMPADAMPFYSPGRKWERKAARLRSLILMYGNFGHNRGMDYIATAPFLKKKAISLRWMTLTSFRQLAIFPLDSLMAWFSKMAAATVKALKFIR